MTQNPGCKQTTAVYLVMQNFQMNGVLLTHKGLSYSSMILDQEDICSPSQISRDQRGFICPNSNLDHDQLLGITQKLIL